MTSEQFEAETWADAVVIKANPAEQEDEIPEGLTPSTTEGAEPATEEQN